MAAKKKTQPPAGDVAKTIVAFVVGDHTEGEGDGAVTYSEGQRLELSQEEFDRLAAAGICQAGVYVKMKTAVEGGRYSLKPHDPTWLAPEVYEAWKALGYCERSDDDPETAAILKARESAVAEAVAQRDAARAKVAELQLEMTAAKVQLASLMQAASGILDGDDDAFAQIKAELQALADMLPDQIEDASAGAAPELNLE